MDSGKFSLVYTECMAGVHNVLPFHGVQSRGTPRRESSVDSSQARPKILIIDDDSEVLLLLKTCLSQNFTVIARNSGEDIESVLETEQPNILMSDLSMPGISGIELCRIIRKNPRHDFLPVIFLSAYDTPQHRKESFDAGCDDFLAKPFNRAELTTKLAVWTRMAIRSQTIMRNNDRLKLMLQTDALTGLFSRRHILDLLNDEFARYRRYQTPMSVLMIDLDDFKNINDNYGHNAGDQALKAAADWIQQCLREVDKAARYGGDEFLILLPSSDLESASVVCRKLQEKPVSVTIRSDQTVSLTLSIGGAGIEGKEHPTALIDAADLAMLIAKKRGKGRWHIANSVTTRKGDDLTELQELNATRSSLRSILCNTFSALLTQTERDDDLINDRNDLMQNLARQMATRTGITTSERITLLNAIRLSHFDRVNLSWEIASKRDSLSEEQRLVLAQTLSHNLNILRKTGYLCEEAEVLAHRHEWFDGSGFPLGLKGQAIPLSSQILTLVASYALLRMGGPHTDEHTPDIAWKLIEGEAGTHFNPALLPLLNSVITDYYADETSPANGSLLLIEDYRPIAALLTRVLTATGYKVEHVPSIPEARRILPTRKWTTILMDLMMPGESGESFLQELSAYAKKEGIPFAIVSARSDESTIEKARDAGAFAYIVKPIRIEKLRKTLLRRFQHGDRVSDFIIIRP